MQFKIESTTIYNMSNWEATHTYDTLNSANNKNNILKQLATYLNDNHPKNCIFIFSSSFKMTNNYTNYFNNGNILSLNILDDLQNIMYLGKIIPFEYNEELSNIQYVLDSYKSLNSIVENYKNTRNRIIKYVSIDLISYINLISEKCIPEILEDMFLNFKNSLAQSSKYTALGEKTIYDEAQKKLFKKYNILLSRYNNYISSCNSNSNSRFLSIFSSFSRPIIGIYNSSNKTIQIVNSDQMYQKGEHCQDELGLVSITRNSPIKITVNTVGIMYDIFENIIATYYSQNGVQAPLKNDNELISDIFNSTDSDINTLAKKVLEKIKNVTNSNIVTLSMTKNN